MMIERYIFVKPLWRPLLVSHVKQKGSWEGSADKLKEFWTDIGIESCVENDPFFTTRWERYRRIDPDCAYNHIIC
jgi:hypothetical protein